MTLMLKEAYEIIYSGMTSPVITWDRTYKFCSFPHLHHLNSIIKHTYFSFNLLCSFMYFYILAKVYSFLIIMKYFIYIWYYEISDMLLFISMVYLIFIHHLKSLKHCTNNFYKLYRYIFLMLAQQNSNIFNIKYETKNWCIDVFSKDRKH